MRLHVVVEVIAVTRTEAGSVHCALGSDGVFTLEREFFAFLPVFFGNSMMVALISAHRCPMVEANT